MPELLRTSKMSLGAKAFGYPYPAYVIGSYNRKGIPNIMAASWCGICCSKPPCVYVSVTKERYTYGNIKHNKAFTVNIPNEALVKVMDYSGIYSGKDENKVESLGLNFVKSDLVNAPLIENFPVIMECEVIKEVEIGSHVQFIGEIKDVKAAESVIDSNNTKITNIEKLKPFFYTPEGNYYGIGEKLARGYSVGMRD